MKKLHYLEKVEKEYRSFKIMEYARRGQNNKAMALILESFPICKPKQSSHTSKDD